MLRQHWHGQLEIHAHDDLGLATANTLAALRAGATYANTTVIGLGERAGNAPLEEVVLAASHCYGRQTGIDPLQLPGLCQQVAAAAGRQIAAQKPLVGDLAFTHESGLHVDGLLKDCRNYQGVDPHLLGARAPSGAGQALGPSRRDGHLFRALGLPLADGDAEPVLQAIRQFAEKQTKLDEGELRALYRTLLCRSHAVNRMNEEVLWSGF